MKPSPRASAALAVLVCLSVLPAVLVVVLATALVLAAVSGAPLVVLLLLGLLTVSAAVAVGQATALVGRHSRQPALGVALSRSAQPRVWALVDELAAAVGARTPDQLRLVADSKVVVSENGRRLGLQAGSRRLYLGVPLVLGLTEQQLRAVVAHELARYGGPGATVYRVKETLRRLVDSLGAETRAGRCAAVYIRPYLAAARAVNQDQEIRAARLSAELAGRTAAVTAIREVPALDQAWQYFVERYVDLGIAERLRPLGVFEGFERFLAEPARQIQLTDIRSDSGAELSTARRIELTKASGEPVADEYRPALGLLDDSRAPLAELETWMFAGSDLVPASWDEIAAAGAAGATRRDAARLTLALEGSGIARPATLITVFDAIRRGDVAAMVEPLVESDTPEAERLELAERLLTRLVTSALVDSGRASYKLNWAGPGRLVGADGREVAPDRLVGRAIGAPDAAYTLQGWLTACGVPPDYRAHTEGISGAQSALTL